MIYFLWLILAFAARGLLRVVFTMGDKTSWAVGSVLAVGGFLVWFVRQPLFARPVKAERTEQHKPG
jgi:hypothetical protein